MRFAQSRALGRKVSDGFTVPVCRTHHREIHRCGDEASWWRNSGVEPLVAARTLWLATLPLPREEATAANNEATANADMALPNRNHRVDRATSVRREQIGRCCLR